MSAAVADPVLHDIVCREVFSRLAAKGFVSAPTADAASDIDVAATDASDPSVGLPLVNGERRQPDYCLHLSVSTRTGTLIWKAYVYGADCSRDEWHERVPLVLEMCLEDI